MPTSKRFLTMVALLIHGYAAWAGFSRPLIWPESKILLFVDVSLLYLLGYHVMNGTKLGIRSQDPT